MAATSRATAAALASVLLSGADSPIAMRLLAFVILGTSISTLTAAFRTARGR